MSNSPPPPPLAPQEEDVLEARLTELNRDVFSKRVLSAAEIRDISSDLLRLADERARPAVEEPE
jgi:hypothetical protein